MRFKIVLMIGNCLSNRENSAIYSLKRKLSTNLSICSWNNNSFILNVSLKNWASSFEENFFLKMTRDWILILWLRNDEVIVQILHIYFLCALKSEIGNKKLIFNYLGSDPTDCQNRLWGVHASRLRVHRQQQKASSKIAQNQRHKRCVKYILILSLFKTSVETYLSPLLY